MQRRLSIAELEGAGVTIRYDEAIAITQRLIEAGTNPESVHEAHPPYGPPTPANVFLSQDGEVACVGCDARVAVSEIGQFLQTLLALDAGRVPGAVRYTVARTLLEVDAPPFDSLEDLSDALARYERVDRSAAIGRLLRRAAEAHTTMAAPAVSDRRRAPADVAELRRQLRAADARVYDQQRALDALGAMTAAPAPRSSRRIAVAAGLAAGLVLIGAGETMRRHEPPSFVVVPPAPAAVTADQAAVEPPVEMSAPIVASTASVKEPARDRMFQSTTKGSRAAVRRASPPGLMQRLRLSWLRTKIAFRKDDL